MSTPSWPGPPDPNQPTGDAAYGAQGPSAQPADHRSQPADQSAPQGGQTQDEQWAAYWAAQQAYSQQQQWAAYWAQQQQWAAYQATLNPATNNMSITAIVLGAVAVLFLPIVFGPAAIIFAAVGKNKGERLSTVALWVSISGTIAGFILSALVYIYVLR